MERLQNEVQSNTAVLRAVHKIVGALCITIICCTITIAAIVGWYGSRVEKTIYLRDRVDQMARARAKTALLLQESRIDISRIRSKLISNPIANAEPIERLNKLESMLGELLETNGGKP